MARRRPESRRDDTVLTQTLRPALRELISTSPSAPPRPCPDSCRLQARCAVTREYQNQAPSACAKSSCAGLRAATPAGFGGIGAIVGSSLVRAASWALALPFVLDRKSTRLNSSHVEIS